MYMYRDLQQIGYEIEAACNFLASGLTCEQDDDFEIGKVVIDVNAEDELPSVEVKKGFDDVCRVWGIKPHDCGNYKWFTDIRGTNIIFYEGAR